MRRAYTLTLLGIQTWEVRLRHESSSSSRQLTERTSSCATCISLPPWTLENLCDRQATLVFDATILIMPSPFRQKTSRKNTRHTPPIPSRPPSNDDDSTRPNVGDEMGSSLSRPTSAPALTRVAEKEIHNIDKLTITQDLVTDVVSNPRISPSPTSIPLNRGSGGYSGLPEPDLDRHNVGKTTSRGRHAKTQYGGPFVGKDPDFDREALVASEFTLPRIPFGTAKRLFDPNNDNTGLAPVVRQSKHQEQGGSARRMQDSKSHMFRPKKTVSNGKGDFLPRVEYEQDSPLVQQVGYDDKQLGNARSAADQAPLVATQEADSDFEPTMIPQPETRPISHDQLVVEVKGIYAGLVMVEAKCIEVDENQSVAAQEKDPSRKNKLSNEQWQALIALHKQLLHEHHDFFLASQHPSASPALSRLAAKYSMPARMWRHGIHAFLEVLRHRLPESLDHMLAFIYIAYSMMALLYETVSTFEDTWIECLGDLARYRMAIEDDDIRDREVWSGVARFWYSKAADKSPNVGRLYHHLAILARPNSLQQLSLYTKSLTCVAPFESTRGSIMTLFTPILHGKESSYHRSSSLENVFIKAHATLFSGGPLSEFGNALQQLRDGLLDNYIGRVTAKFKEQGVFAAVTNIAALLEYGALKERGLHKSLVRLAFEEVNFQKKQITNPRSMHSSAEYLDVDDDATHHAPLASSIQSTFSNLTASEIESSEVIISHASKITFTTLSISLQRIGDKNVFPLVHVSFVFLWSLVIVEKAMKYVERDVPWGDICSFLNTLARPEVMTPRVWGEGFPKTSDGVDRPLPEDFALRGQLYSQNYFPGNWFQEAMIDDEERALELPSMAAPRLERILWLGIRIACVCSASPG